MVMLPRRSGIALVIERLWPFVLAAIAALAMAVNCFVESFHAARLGALLTILLTFHLLTRPKILFTRELGLYALFVSYLVLQLLWTPDVRLAMNTLAPAVTFLLILMYFGVLAQHHDFNAVLGGALSGMTVGAILHTGVTGFPFIYPAGFSYNAIAGMYLSGLFMALLLSSRTRSKGLCLGIALVFLLLVVATTSIKTNLGILLGIVVAVLMYFKRFLAALRRRAVSWAALACLLGVAVASNGALVQRLENGLARLALGIEVLRSREDVQGYSAFDDRGRWLHEGVVGWLQNPMFGHGVEAFRARFDITSHSTPVDLLYNSGVIGFALFYGMFLSVAARLRYASDSGFRGASAAIMGTLVCYLFTTLSGTMHYNSLLGLFIALSAASLRRMQARAHGCTASCVVGRL